MRDKRAPEAVNDRFHRPRVHEHAGGLWDHTPNFQEARQVSQNDSLWYIVVYGNTVIMNLYRAAVGQPVAPSQFACETVVQVPLSRVDVSLMDVFSKCGEKEPGYIMTLSASFCFETHKPG